MSSGTLQNAAPQRQKLPKNGAEVLPFLLQKCWQETNLKEVGKRRLNRSPGK